MDHDLATQAAIAIQAHYVAARSLDKYANSIDDPAFRLVLGLQAHAHQQSATMHHMVLQQLVAEPRPWWKFWG